MVASPARSTLRIIDNGARPAGGAEAAAPPVVILMNVGTPDEPTTGAVRRYLKEFLSDPRVIDIPALARWALLRFIILPFRSPKSARLYRSVWTPDGSPLLVHSKALAAKVQARLPGARVVLGMRYGNPSLKDAVVALARSGTGRVVLVPLFPQYASASTGTALAEAYRLLGGLPRVPDVSVVAPFFDEEKFQEAVSSTIRESMSSAGKPVDHVLFSYHGIPLGHVQQVHSGCAGTDSCCATLGAHNAHCYRAQCMATTAAVARRVGLGAGTFSTSFQSRLGRAQWLTPSTPDTIAALAKNGTRRLAVVCPSFFSDCLETVEEVGVQAREQFLAAGGEELVRVPCINAREDAAEAVEQWVRRALPELPAAGATATDDVERTHG